MEKLVKMAKRLDRLLKALQIAIVAFCALLVILSGFGGTWSYRPFSSTLYLSAANDARILLSAPVGWFLFLASMAVALYGLHIFRRILLPMKRGEPFAKSVSGDMRRLGWLVLIAGGALSLANSIGQAYAVSSELVVQTHRLDLSFLFVAAILFLFSYIFRYGEELQRLSDETL